MSKEVRQEIAYLTRTPSLSGMAHQLLEVPLWLPPTSAARMATFAWSGGGWNLHCANPIAPLGEHPDRSSSGLLRYRDLDALLAITHLWISQGQNPSGEVVCELHDLFRWMGYSSDLTVAPYSEIRASIHRLSACRIVIFHDSDRDEVKRDRSRYDYTLLSSVSTTRQARPGRPSIMTATLHPQVLDWMNERCQAIDLDVYAHLVRHPATRRLPLARIVWVALTRHRQADASLRFRAGWLALRYGDRRNIAPDGFGSFVYRDAYNPKSRLGRAISGLARAGVLGIRPAGTPDDWITGRFMVPKDIRRLRDEPRQKTLFHLDTMAIAEAAARGEPEPQPQVLPAPAAPSPSDRRRRLLARCRVSASVIRAATAGGWSDDQVDRLLLAALYGRHLGQVRSPAAWAASRLREDDPTSWTADAVHEAISVPDARTWAHAPGGPLSDT